MSLGADRLSPEIGDIGLFPQPGTDGFPAVGVYPGLVVGFNGLYSGFNGTVTVTAAAEPGLLALLSAGFCCLRSGHFEHSYREPNIGFNALNCSG